MNISTIWKGTKTGKNKKRPAYKPKIRWQLLGLSDPGVEHSTASIETIRREVSSLASRGFGQGTRSRSSAQSGKALERSHQAGMNRPRRRGATE